MFNNHEHKGKLLHLGAILIVIAVLFVSYYVLIARPKIKAECLEASTNIVSNGEDSRNRSLGDGVAFDEAKYNQCVNIF